MGKRLFVMLQVALFSILCAAGAGAQTSSGGPVLYMDPSQPIDARVDDLIHRMTLEQKASQVVNQARAIPELNIPAYDWWSEALHGVANAGTATVFPEPIGLAATFDDSLIHEMAVVIGTEARAKHDQAVQSWAPRHHGRPRLLVAQYQHLSRSTVGARPGNLRRRSISHRSHGRGVCDRATRR